jgi:hypothetical protein
MEYIGCYIAFALFFVLVVAMILFAYSLRLRCPRCRGEIKEEKCEVIFKPTKKRPGVEKTTYECISCGHIFAKLKSLPQLGAWSTGADAYEKVSDAPPRWSRSPWVSSLSKHGWRHAPTPKKSLRMFGGGKSAGSGASSSF